MPNAPHTYTARWVWTGPGGLVPGAAVTLQDGFITAVEAHPPRGTAVTDLGEGLLLPGLVNAHTHLELSGLAGLVPPNGDFVDWLEQMVAMRPDTLRVGGAEATAKAVAGLARDGTALVGDITNTGKAAADLAQAGVSAVSFYEALGAARAEPPQAMAQWRGTLLSAAAVAAHAPYSVPTERLAGLKARAGDLPFCMHLAESRAEVEFLAGNGPEGERLDRFLTKRGLRRQDLHLASSTPLGQLEAAKALDASTLLVHGVQLTSAEAKRIARAGASLCVCPRSNLGLTKAIAPVEELLAVGVNLALGTDSLASAPDLSLWAEMTALAQAKPNLAPEAILTMATQGGASALGQAGSFGVLAPGAAGPLAFAPLSELGQDEVIAAVVRGEHAGSPRSVGRVV
ncbi:MAG: amidohydrolase family protein [Desulfarculaceae bacterium]|nr:amidohydrolase family protein [Desulfarculaceae bacterium]MCF8072195.1 amidohydrolase family protein [Desulfarculaceae bacterium]MCF8100116.1 amidohydrolase family protein [Desulfarculaceae bacterium]